MQSSRLSGLSRPIILLFALSLVLILSMPTAAVAKSKAKITWQPRTLEVNLLAGTSTIREVEFTSTGDIDDVSFFVTPELAPYLSVEAFGLDLIRNDSSYSALLIFDAPPSSPIGVYEGTIHLREGNRSVPQTLKLVIEIVQATASTVPLSTAMPSESRIQLDTDGQYSVVGEFIVGLDLETQNPDSRIAEIAASTGAVLLGSVPDTLTYQLLYHFEVQNEYSDMQNLLQSLDQVTFVSHHFLAPSIENSLEVPFFQPQNDDLYSDDAYDESFPRGRNWYFEVIKAQGAWALTTGSSEVTVGVIDQGFDVNHPDLVNNILFPQLVNPANVFRTNGHGTHVSGLICADGNNGQGMMGISWDCSLRLYGQTLIPAAKEWFLLSPVHTLELMKQAVNDDVQIVNMSIGYQDVMLSRLQPGCPKADNKTLQRIGEINDVLGRGIEYGRQQYKDMLWVFSAGNCAMNANFQSPASLAIEYPENTITVAASAEAFLPESGSNSRSYFLWGDMKNVGSNFGPTISVGAPGEYIWSSVPSWFSKDSRKGCLGDAFMLFNNNEVAEAYCPMSGTSMAAPIVTGLASLVKSANPDFTAAQIKECIVQAAELYGPQVVEHEFHVISAPEAVFCDFPETPSLQRLEVHGRSMSNNGRYVVHDASERRVPQLDTNFHTDIYMYDLEVPNPGENPVLASVSLSGVAGNLASKLRWDQLAVSNSGRVVFQSAATDLVAGDINQVQDIFIRDFSVNPPATVQVSVRSDGTPNKTYHTMPALNPSLSIDGRYVSFESDFRFAAYASYTISDIYLRDVDGHGTYLVSQRRDDARYGGNADSTGSLVSANGEFVAFNTLASNIGVGVTDNNGLSDVYLYDIAQSQVTERISVGNDGSDPNGNSVLHSISREGRYVLFYSTAQGLGVDGGVNSGNYSYLYLRDRDLQTTTEINKVWNGYDLSRSRMVRVTEDGRYLAFWANQWTPGHSDVLLWDRQKDVLTRLSQGFNFDENLPVEPSNGSSMIGFINNDTQVAFLSAANNLVPGDDNGEVVDTFIYTIP